MKLLEMIIFNGWKRPMGTFFKTVEECHHCFLYWKSYKNCDIVIKKELKGWKIIVKYNILNQILCLQRKDASKNEK